MPRKRKSRIYRKRDRWYGDFRDLGGRLEALKAEGEATATTDPDVAAALATKRVEELEARRATPRERTFLGVERHATLGTFAADHLEAKAKAGRVGDPHLANSEKHFERACAFFGTGREIRTIGVRDVERWMHALSERPNGRGGTLSPKTVREHLNTLSNLYRRAQGEAAVPPGFNPVAAVMDKPVARQREARWFEIHDAALVLEAARLYEPPPDKHGCPFMYAIVATALLTGGRKREILGLEVDDVSFDRRTITFRPNAHRRLKSRTSHRSVPVWPHHWRRSFGCTCSGAQGRVVGSCSLPSEPAE
jgi:integrase